jgi:predicted metal-dependent TIM-barrel fold hydrolase
MQTEVTNTVLPVGNVKNVISQKEAVYTAVMNAVKISDLSDGQTLAQYVNTNKTVKKAIKNEILVGLTNGTVTLRTSKTEKELKKYASGLLNNHLAKDARLN